MNSSISHTPKGAHAIMKIQARKRALQSWNTEQKEVVPYDSISHAITVAPCGDGECAIETYQK